MAEKRIINIEVNTEDADKKVNSLNTSFENLGDSIKEGNKEATESFKKLAEETENAKKGTEGLNTASKKTSKGVKGIGTALKAIGIGAVIAAFVKLSEIFGRNQKSADAFNKVFTAVGLVLDDFISLVVDNFPKVISFFKDVFNNPLASIKKLGNAIKDNITERFVSLIDTLGFTGSAIKKFITGDFKGAIDDAKKAGKEFVDVYTGVDGTVDKVKNTVSELSDKTKEYAKNTFDAAASIVELKKQAELSLAVNQGLIEKYDRQAEKLRQVRDDERLSIDERIKANKDLGDVLAEQEKVMLANADINVRLAKEQRDRNKGNVELEKAYQEALNERAAIQAQVTGFVSEQQVNEVSLLKEKKEIQLELNKIGKTDLEQKRIDAEADFELQKEIINRQVADENEKNRLLEEAERVFRENLALIDEEDKAKKEEKRLAEEEKQAEIDAKELERKQRIADEEDRLEQAKRDSREATLDTAVQLAGAETKLGKALLVAKQVLLLKELILDSKKLISKSKTALVSAKINAAESGTELAKGSAKAAAAAPPPFNLPFILTFAATSAGIISSISSAVSKTKSVTAQAGVGGGGSISIPKINAGGGSAPKPPTAASVPPSFNVVGASQTSQLSDVINNQTNQPLKAFVVSKDVTTAQELDRNIINQASI